MEERSTFTPGALRSVVLVVGCRGALLERCRAVAALAGIELGVAELLTLAGQAAAFRPLALLLSAELYAFDPEEFDALAIAVGARVVLVEDGDPLDRLALQLRDVVAVQQEARAREVAELAAARGGPVSGPRHSRVRWRDSHGQDEGVPSSRARAVG